MTDIELLPLPEPEVHDAAGYRRAFTPEQMQNYARANVDHHAAAKDAEIEALRAEVERLAEALREVESELGPEVPLESDDTNPVHRALDAAMAALNQEEGT